MRTSQILFQNTDNKSSITSAPVRADLWYGAANHIYTIAIHSSAFNGSVQAQGTIVPSPQDIDWFAVGDPATFDPLVQGSHAYSFSFCGLYTWVRVLIIGTSGYIDRVLINQ